MPNTSNDTTPCWRCIKKIGESVGWYSPRLKIQWYHHGPPSVYRLILTHDAAHQAWGNSASMDPIGFSRQTSHVLGIPLLFVSSCLFVNFGRQQAFSLNYFGCGMQQAFYQNPSVRKTLLSFVWWIHQVFTKFSPGFGIHQDFTRFCKFTRIPSVFTKTRSKFNQLTKFSPSCLKESPGFHQVTSFEIAHQVFTKIKQTTWWIHQILILASFHQK